MTITGNPAEFTVNGVAATVNSLTVPFSPIQDLHGYSNPWPGGGGKNKFYYPTNFNTTSSYGLVYKYDKDTETFSITGTNTKTSAYIALYLKTSDGTATPSLTVGQTCYVYHNLPTGTYINLTYLDGNGANKAFSIIGGGAGTGDYVQRSLIVPNDYASFSQVQIGVYGSATQINKTDIHIALGTDSAFTEWTPYSNICPISGLTGLSVYRTGKNMCSVNELPANPTYYWGSNYSIIVNILNTLPTGTYTMYVTQEVVTMPSNGKVAHGRPFLTALQNGTQTPVLSYSVASDDSPYVGKTYRDGGTFTITEEIKGNFNNAYFYCDQRDTHSGNGRGTYNVKEIQIELGSHATTYEPYNGNTYSVDWTTQAGTVYGGSLDVTTGVLTVDRAIVDLGTLTWRTSSEHKFYAATTGVVVYKPYTPQMLCDTYKFAGARSASPWFGDENELTCYYVGTSIVRELYINEPAYTDVTEFKAAMSGVQLCYELATPLTYQLTPQTINLLAGIINYVWSDTDEDITISFDVAAFIRQLFRVNGVDFSRFVERDSYATSLEPVYAETIQTMDGVNHTALLRTRGSIRLRFNPQTDSDTAALCSALLAAPCEVQYRCLQRDVDVTALMCVDTISAQFLSRCLYLGDEWNQIESITLTEL